MKVINLFAGPGAGKSTTAAGLFNLMKLRGHKVELVTEYAKDLTYEKAHDKLQDQEHILEEQFKRQERLVGHVDWIITDSPLLLSHIYYKGSDKNFRNQITNFFDFYDNENFFLKRTKPYSRYGRSQTSDEAKEIDRQILDMLEEQKFGYTILLGDEDAHVLIYNILFKRYEIVLLETLG